MHFNACAADYSCYQRRKTSDTRNDINLHKSTIFFSQSTADRADSVRIASARAQSTQKKVPTAYALPAHAHHQRRNGADSERIASERAPRTKNRVEVKQKMRIASACKRRALCCQRTRCQRTHTVQHAEQQRRALCCQRTHCQRTHTVQHAEQQRSLRRGGIGKAFRHFTT